MLPPPAASAKPLDVRCITCLDAIAEAGCEPPPPPLPPPETSLPGSRAVVIILQVAQDRDTAAYQVPHLLPQPNVPNP